MRRTPSHVAIFAVTLTALAGCDTALDMGEAMPAEDAVFLAEELDLVEGGMLDALFLAGGPAATPTTLPPSSVTVITFDRTSACREGGTLQVTGEITKVWDGQALTYDITGEGTSARDGCAFARHEVVITVDGSGEWTHERHYLDHHRSGVWMSTRSGEFDWSKSTGESGSCTYDLTRTLDTQTRSYSLVGTFCGTEIDRSRQLFDHVGDESAD